MRLVNCTRTLLVIAGVCWPAAAHASEAYLDHLYYTYGWESLECTVCHVTQPGKEGTARTLFATQLKDNGAIGDDLNSLISALSQMEAEGLASDADQDGYGDIEELRANTDPNDFYDPPFEDPPDTSTSTSASTSAGGTDASGSGTGGTDAGGSSAGGASDDDDQGDDGGPSPIAGASTTGRVRPSKPPPAPELPPTLKTGCALSAPAATQTPWFPALVLGGLVFARRSRRLRAG